MAMKEKVIGAGPFDGAKFMSRYSLTRDDFFVRGDTLFYPDTLPDPGSIVIEAPDPALTKPTAELGRLRTGTASLTDVNAILRWQHNVR